MNLRTNCFALQSNQILVFSFPWYPIRYSLKKKLITYNSLLIIQIEILHTRIEGVSRSMKKVRRIIIISLVVRYAAIIICTFLLIDHVLVGRIWFNPLTPITQIQDALKRGADPNAYNDDGMTGVIFSVWNNNRFIAKLLIDAGADVNALSKDSTLISPRPSRNTALHYAIRNSNTDDGLDMLELLLEMGADVRKQNSEGNEPIHVVWRVGGFDMLSADPSSSGFYNPNLINPSKRVDLLRILLKHGADINARNRGGDTLLHRMVDMRNVGGVMDLVNEWTSLIDWGVRNDKGQTVTQLAGMFRSDQILDMFMHRPAIVGSDGNPNAKNAAGLNGIMLAAMRGDGEMVKKLVASPGSNINDRSFDKDKYTALVLAVYQRRPLMVELLLNLGASPLVTDAYGNTALHRVMQVPDFNVQKTMIDLMLKNEKIRSDLVNKQNNSGQTIFHWLVRMNRLDVLKYLVEKYGKYINVRLQDENRKSAMGYATEINRPEMVKIFEKLR